MAQNHSAEYTEKPMTRDGRIQGPSRRYRRLRNPTFPSTEWTAKNPLLQRGEIGAEADTHRIKVGDGLTYWNDLPYTSDVIATWGAINGDITDQTDLTQYIADEIADEATLRENADTALGGRIDDEINNRTDADTALQGQITANKGTMDDHIADKANPHEVTKTQVGLGNCDNTSDLNKPISTATQTALDGKVAKNADITGATKCKITYDNKGLVTAGADLAESDVPSLHLSKISDVTATASELNVLDGITATTAELNYTDGVTSNIQTQLDGKQATISDLATIRSNASAGKAASDTIATYGDIVTHDVSEFATAAQGALADTALQPGDNVSDLVNDAGYLTQHQSLTDLGITATASEINVLDGITASTTELNYVDGVTSAIQTQIDGKQAKSASAYNMGNSSGGWTAMSNTQQDALNSGANTTNIGQIATNTSDIADEILDRQSADNGLQQQIDALVAKSDVVDIVGTYADLQAYDTSDLGNNDVVKVLDDSTHNNAPSYYRWVITGGVGAWVYIGSESETYTKAEIDALLNAKQDTISATDGITLTGTTLTNSGVRAVASGTANGTISVNTNGTTADVAVTGLGSAAYTASSAYATSTQGGKADTAVQPGDLATVATSGDYDDLLNKPTIPTVNDATLTIQKNGTSVATFTANASSAVTANITVPTTTNDLTNNSGFITSSDIPVTDVTVGGTSVVSAGVAAVPAIPTVNNSTITITQGGVTKGSFTLNQASGDTIALDAGGGGSLSSLSDVTLTTPTDGQVLTYDNGDWVNADPTGGGYHPDLFSWQWADHEINDMQWLRADTFSWQDGTVYAVGYNHLSDDISGKSLQSETISGTTVQFYVADDGHKICPASEESNVAAIYTATGVAWYYILDTVNQRFKLPRTKFGVTGLRDTVGKYVPESLPNIKGTAQGFPKWSNNAVFADTGLLSGAFSLGTTGTGSGSAVNTSAASSQYNSFKTYDIFNAGSYSSTYQDSAPVQPQATQMYLYFYVGTFTQTALENTAGLNAELFNGKADVTALLSKLNTSADNLTATGLTNLFGYLAPDFTAGVSKAANTTHTADTDGWVWVYQFSSGDRYFYIDGVQVHLGAGNGSPQYSGNGALIPIAKGHTYLGNGSITFYPVIGV